MSKNNLHNFISRDSLLLFFVLLLFVGIQFGLDRLSGTIVPANMFVVYGSLLIFFPVGVAHFLVLIAVFYLFVPLHVSEYLYVFAFSSSLLLTCMFVRKYFEYGTTLIPIFSAVLISLLFHGIYYCLTIILEGQSIEFMRVEIIFRELFMNLVFIIVIQLLSKFVLRLK